MSDTGDLINPTFEVVHTYCTSTRSSLLGNIKEERIYDPIPNVLLPHLGFKISLRERERADVESSVRCKTLGFQIHGFGRIPVAGGWFENPPG